MGSWKTRAGITISDQFADSIEDKMDELAQFFKETWPDSVLDEFKETVRFVLGRDYKAYKEGK